MLDGCTHVVALDAPDVCGGHVTGEDGILGEILEITSAQRVAVDVDTGGKDDVDAVFKNFVAHCRGHLLHQVHVPGGGDKRADRETGTVERVGSTLAGGLDTEAGRAVGENCVGNAETGDGAGVAGSAGHLVDEAGGDTLHHRGLCAADEQGRLLFKGHRLDDLIDIVFPELGLGEGGHRQQSRGQNHNLFHKMLTIN